MFRRGGLDGAVSKAREMCLKTPQLAQARRSHIQNILGPRGIRMRAAIQRRNADDVLEKDDEANREVEAAFNRWSRPVSCSLNGEDSLQGMQQLILGEEFDGTGRLQ